jgi:small subunit ribosomal protein S3Ae
MAKKIKGKDWYTILAPKIFQEKVVGETPADDAKKVIGRTVDMPMVLLTNDMSKYYLKAKLKVVRVDGLKAYTELAGLECLRDYIARVIRHRVTRIDTVQRLETKDGKKVAVKTVVVTSRRVTRGVEKGIKKFVEDVIATTVKESSLDELVTKILKDSLKQKIMKEGSKIYPLKFFDVRKLEVKV